MRKEIRFWITSILISAVLTICNGEPSFLDSFSFLNPSQSQKSVDYTETVSRKGKVDVDDLDPLRLNFAQTQPFIQRRLFNTSVALTVPLFSFTLPQRAAQGSSVDLANQAIFGLFTLLVTVLIFTIPVMLTGSRPAGIGRSNKGTQGILDHLMASTPMFNLMNADLSHKIGLDSTKCLQKTICEAHRYPKNKHFGLLALPFQIFFPPPGSATPDARASFFQLAARKGKYSKKECGEQFRCFFDILDLAVYFVDWYHYTADPNSYYAYQNENQI